MKDESKFVPEPFLIQIVSGGEGKHCDIYPFGSFHEVTVSEEGRLNPVGKIDTIPKEFVVKKVKTMVAVKTCSSCHNEFPISWPFITSASGMNLQGHDKIHDCIRCFERKNILHRDMYREAIRQELILEHNLNKK